MKLFDEIQAGYLTPEVGPGRKYGRLGTNNGRGVDTLFQLEKMHKEDEAFQREIDKRLSCEFEATIADNKKGKER